MDKMNCSAPKLHAIGPSIALCEYNTVAINCNERDSEPKSFVIGEKPLEPGEIFIIEVKETKNKEGNEDEKTDESPIRFSLVNRCKSPQTLDMNNNEMFPFDKIETSYSYATLLRPSRLLEREDCCMDEEFEIYKDTMQTCYDNVLLDILNRLFFVLFSTEHLNEIPGTNYIGIFYFRKPGSRFFHMYTLSKRGCLVDKHFHLSSGKPTYVLMEMKKCVKRIRTIPSYHVPLQDLYRGDIFEHVTAKSIKKFSEKLLLKIKIGKLTIHSGKRNTTSTHMYSC